MENFSYLFERYNAASNWNVVKRIYSNSGRRLEISLWLFKVIYLVLAVTSILTTSTSLLISSICVALVWFWLVSFTRKVVFANEFNLYPVQMEEFSYDYQFIRYLDFKNLVINDGYKGDSTDDQKFIENLIETGKKEVSPTKLVYVSSLISAIIAIVASNASTWPTKVIFFSIVLLGVLLIAAHLSSNIGRSRSAKLNELRRFLCWLDSERKIKAAPKFEVVANRSDGHPDVASNAKNKSEKKTE